MNILGLDIGSSSVKAGIVNGGRIVGELSRASYATHFDGARAEIDPSKLLRAIAAAVANLGPRAKKVEAIGLSLMSPAWVAMDRGGKPLTPIITHQDRRSVEVARRLLKRVGSRRWLAVAGNLPFPGGISATTLAWFIEHSPGVIHKADLVGHLNTFLHRQLTGQRVIDRSNASFTGLYETVKQGGWSEELCEAVGISISKLPDIFESNFLPGCVTGPAASKMGLTQGTPLFAGMIDTSAAMMLAGAQPGQLLNVSGSTDVLGLCTDRPHPHEKLLTRALGIGKLWMSVGTLAAAGSAITWVKDQFFRELSTDEFYRLVSRLAGRSQRSARFNPEQSAVHFDPYLAGERTSIEQKTASLTGLTLASSREDILLAVIDALAQASGARLELLAQTGARINHKVITSGGAARSLHNVLHRDWPGKWRFMERDEASLRGLSMLNPKMQGAS
jgi:xylulokinase